MATSSELQESRRAQLSELNQRVRNHVSALWQMPTAYLGIVAIVLAQSNTPNFGTAAAASLLFFAGFAVMWAMFGWTEGAHRAVSNIRTMEELLELPVTAQRRFWSHVFPHFLLVAIGMLACLLYAA